MTGKQPDAIIVKNAEVRSVVRWFRQLHQLPFSRLMEVYAEANLEKAREDFSDFPLEARLRMAEADFYQYLGEVFFRTKGACYALWEEEGKFVSALRLEPYQDGLLLSALETAPAHRCRGYGKALVMAALDEMPGTKIYSHVSKTNLPSLRLHEACGFVRIRETAHYLDGSVNGKCCTFLYEKACI